MTIRREQAEPGTREKRDRVRRPAGLLAGMRIRKKLIVLHTSFSLVLAGIMAVALRPAVGEVVRRAERHEGRVVLAAAMLEREIARQDGRAPAEQAGLLARLNEPSGVMLRAGTAEQLGLPAEVAQRAMAEPGEIVEVSPAADPPAMVVYDAGAGEFVQVSARLEEAREAVLRLYLLALLALLAVYGLVAAALELFVLPQHVYEPIRRMQEADRAVQEGRREEELIPESAMPADELGEIMRSRNASIVALREHERALAEALRQLEQVATDLKRKNHLIEMAQRNLADADRLASLGMMSAGLSHEMNTPLAVLKGLAEKLARGRGVVGAGGLSEEEAALMVRVVGRLERLSESLLDFARVRPPQSRPTDLRGLVEEAWTLVSLDREAKEVRFEDRVPEGTIVECDPDRIVQVLVNLLRNSVDALEGSMARGGGGRRGGASAAGAGARGEAGGGGSGGGGGGRGGGRIVVASELLEREGRRWVSLTITDDGPGIDPEVLKRLFEPFVSAKLDSRGTGLGLAVAEGIVREHHGLLLARNREDDHGAVFEVMLPMEASPRDG